jgi:hypothetical protein
MAAFFLIKCAGETYSVPFAENYYLLPEGERLTVRVCPAWCGDCRGFVEAERVPSWGSLAEDVRELEYFAERPGLIPEDRPMVASMIRYLPEERVRLRWRLTRVGPPRCLECGSSNFTPFDGDNAVDIPGVGRCTGCVLHLSGPIRAVRYFSPEGLRVGVAKPMPPSRG